MLNGKATIVLLIAGLIRRHNINELIFPKTNMFRIKCKN